MSRSIATLWKVPLVAMALAASVRADEGMWLFNRLPVETLAERYGFRPSQEWADHVMRSSARISTGGSGSVVSSSGLVMTNHHVISTCLQQLSSKERNYLEDGFFARTLEEELQCPNTEVLLLREIRDVSDRVHGAVKPGMSSGEAEQARLAEQATIEQEAKDATGFHTEVVQLYRGGEYHLYLYKRYDDVRMVFAPEVSIAFFGGDGDNFEFPRYCLDAAFIRLWEDGKPAQMDDWLRWSQKGVGEGDLIFVSGHPGRTQRLNTVDHLRYLRDVAYPSFLELLYRREIALQQYGLKSAEAKRVAKDDLFSIQNSRKALRGILAGLQNPSILASKLESEAALKAYVATHPDSGASLEDWDAISQSMTASESIRREYVFLEGSRAFWSDLFSMARTILRLVEESSKPNAERLPEFRETAIPSVKMRLFSPAPIDRDLEVAKLTDSLTHFAEVFGAEHPLAKIVLGGKGPADRAHELIAGTNLFDVEARKRWVEGGTEAVSASEDTMIRLARAIDPYARGRRREFEDLVTSVRTDAYAHISKAAFAATGTGVYPDATFTLRLAIGVVQGWEEGGETIPAFTRVAGAYERARDARNEEPYRLPMSWIDPKSRALRDLAHDIDWSSRSWLIDGETPFNFVSTADIIGGNSGSPVINRDGEVVGLIFDGNIHGLVLDIVYTEEKARAVAVNAEAILAALRSAYDMKRIVEELAGSP